MRLQSRVFSRRAISVAASLLAVSVALTACGGTKAGQGDKATKDAQAVLHEPETNLANAGKPQRGGNLIYGVEADTSGGFCLPEGQLAISGMLVVRAVYDTLTVPNANGDYVPYLAKSISHNAKYDEWTIGLRSGIKFSDGTPLTAQVVKDNLDAYRGTFPGRSPLLFTFVLKNIDSVTTTGPLTVKVKTKVPWVAFPAYLYSSSRMGIMGEKQLRDKNNCGTDLIGTGPFNKNPRYVPNQKVTAQANPNYWQTAPDGKPYPYADSIEFRVLPSGVIRDQAIISGDINVMHTTDTENVTGELLTAEKAGKINMLVSEASAEVSFLQLNDAAPPFDNLKMRQALAMGADRNAINQDQNNGVPTVANGPFAPDSIAFLQNTGFPKFNLAKAKALVKEYVKEGGKAEFSLTTTTDPSTLRLAQLIQQKAQQTGVKVKLITRDQAALINDAIGHKFQAMVFRNLPGGDPDGNYVWWYGKDKSGAENPVNFSGYSDPVINKLLDEGRSEPDPAKRKTIYQNINREFGKMVWENWAWFTPWAVAENVKVHDILGPPLPGDDPSKPGDASTTDKSREPSPGLATGHSLIGLWIEK
jgi:peptide/nickel transport system substrate-binding protein